MARTMKKFSAGGAQGRYDRRMADIEKDYAKAMARKTGKAAEVAEAKRQQRIADAKDDLAKRTGADRSATRAAERAAESNLTKTRKYGAPKAVTAEAPAGKVSDTLGAITAPKSGLATSPAKKAEVKKTATPAKVDTTPKRMGDQGFAYKKKDMATTGQGVSTHRRYVRGGSNSGAAADGTAAKRLEAKGLKTGDTKTGTTSTGPSTKTGVHSNSIAGMLARGTFPNPFKGLRFTNEEDMKAYYARQAEGKAKGGKVMKYAKGGSTSPQPSAADRARSKKHLDELKKLKPTAKEGKVVASANRSEGPGFKKGGSMASCGMKKGGKATKFGAAMKKKSADTKGRAMMKFAKGGSIDGCAVKGKTKTSMIKMKKGGSC
jgi:hypothetical protein